MAKPYMARLRKDYALLQQVLTRVDLTAAICGRVLFDLELSVMWQNPTDNVRAAPLPENLLDWYNQ
jgi:hypothetical protein